MLLIFPIPALMMNNNLPRAVVPGITFREPSLCQSHLSKMCDINNMIERVVSGDLSVLRRCNYGDYTGLPEDTQGMLNCAIHLRDRFESLPAGLRSLYPTPESLLSALSTPEGISALEAQGFVKRPFPAVSGDSKAQPASAAPAAVTPNGAPSVV